MSQRQLVESVYDSLVKFYDIPFGHFFTKARRRVIAHMDIQPGDRILEVGVGTGLTLEQFPSDVDYEFYGVDISAGMMKKARKRAEEDGRENVRLLRMDAGRLAFPDDTFDQVCAFLVLSVVPDPVLALAEMTRVCKPDGHIIFTNHFQRERGFISFLEDVSSPLFRQAGFRMDLKLSELVRGAAVEIQFVEGLFFNHWQIVSCRPLPRPSYYRKPLPVDDMDRVNASIRRKGRILRRKKRRIRKAKANA